MMYCEEQPGPRHRPETLITGSPPMVMEGGDPMSQEFKGALLAGQIRGLQ